MKKILFIIIFLLFSCSKDEMNCSEIESIIGNGRFVIYHLKNGESHKPTEHKEVFNVGDIYCK